MRFGHLETKKYRGNKWLCDCDCGCSVLVSNSDLASGRVTHCGCLDAPAEPEPLLPDVPAMAPMIEYLNGKPVCIVGVVDGVKVGLFTVDGLRGVLRQWDAAMFREAAE